MHLQQLNISWLVAAVAVVLGLEAEAVLVVIEQRQGHLERTLLLKVKCLLQQEQLILLLLVLVAGLHTIMEL
jgi:hypothetical protein